MRPDDRRSPVRQGSRLARTLSVMMILLTVGCSDARSPSPSGEEQPGTAAGTTVATFDDHGIRFDYPSAWARRDPIGPEDTAWDVAVGPVDDLGYVSVFAVEFPGAPTGARVVVAREVFDFVRSEASGDEPTGKVVLTSLDGFDALEARFRRPGAGDLAPAEILAIASRVGDTFIIVNCFAPTDGSVGAGCDQVVNTFRIQDR